MRRGCAEHRTREHYALSAMLTISQLSKSFAGRALFDDVSLQVFLGLLPATVGDTDAKAMSSLLVIAPAKGTRIIQILSAINYRFLGPNFR